MNAGIISVYRIISADGVEIMARTPPIELFIQERDIKKRLNLMKGGSYTKDGRCKVRKESTQHGQGS